MGCSGSIGARDLLHRSRKDSGQVPKMTSQKITNWEGKETVPTPVHSGKRKPITSELTQRPRIEFHIPGRR